MLDLSCRFRSICGFELIIESENVLGWKGPYRVPTPCHGQGPLPPAQGAPSPVQPGLEPCQGRTATASLGSLGQGLTSLMVKNFYLIPNLNLPSFTLNPSPLVLSLHALVKSPSPAQLKAPFKYWQLL